MLAEFFRRLTEMRRARILGLIDPMPEAGDLLVRLELLGDIRLHSGWLANLLQHLHDLLVGSAVQGTR